MTTTTTRFAGVEATTARPTQAHRIVMFYGLFGTVYAVSPEGETRYFDYDLEGAREFAGIEGADLRVARAPRAVQVGRGADATVAKGQRALYAKRGA